MDEHKHEEDGDISERQDVTDPCAEIDPSMNDYLICVIQNTYGVSIAGDFSFEQLQFILSALQTVSDQIMACVSELGISVSEAFRVVFGDVSFVYDATRNSSITGTEYDEQGNPVSTITLDDSAFYNSQGQTYNDATRVIRHELGHAFLNAFGELDPEIILGLTGVVWFINGNRYEIPLGQRFTERLLYDYLGAFTGWEWNPNPSINSYYAGNFIVDVTIDGETQTVDLSEYYFNVTDENASPHPREDFADNFAISTALPDDATDREALLNSPRVKFFP